jgi:hypothetical protein
MQRQYLFQTSFLYTFVSQTSQWMDVSNLWNRFLYGPSYLTTTISKTVTSCLHELVLVWGNPIDTSMLMGRWYTQDF